MGVCIIYCEGNFHLGQRVDRAGNCRDVMMQFAEEQYTSDAHHSGLPEKIWMDTCNHFHTSIGNNFIGLTKT